MRNLKLSTKLFVVSGVTLILFLAFSFLVLFQAQSRQASQEMDHLLKNEVLALSVLVNTSAVSKFEFEISQLFLEQYSHHNPGGFFRFIDPVTNKPLVESMQSPQIECNQELSHREITYKEKSYRVESSVFFPEIEGGSKDNLHASLSPVCLVVGIDKSPYASMVARTMMASVPLLAALFLVLVAVMFILIRSMTADLKLLTKSLETADFRATHEFPSLPNANTLEIKAVVEKLEALHSQASQVYKDMWLFLGRAAHQIKTPVTAMQATLEVLLRKDRSQEELFAALVDIKIAANSLGSLTKKLMYSSRLSYQEVPPFESIDLEGYFSEMTSFFKDKAEAHRVSFEMFGTAETVILGNKSLMNDVFGNIVENAIIYSPHDKMNIVKISWRRVNNEIAVEVADSGPGFPDQVLQSFFQPFVRGDERNVQGSGLGLFIAKKSAQILGGDLNLASTSKEGSRFLVSLPVKD